MARPTNLVDRVHDFGPNGDIPLYLPIESSAFSSKMTTQEGARTAIAHYVFQGTPTLPKLQNASGQDVPPGSPVVIKEALPGNNNFTNTNVTIKDLTPSNTPSFQCRIDSPYRWESDFAFYITPFFFGQDTYVNMQQPEYYIYKVFQKSIAIIEDVSSSPIIVNGQTSNVSLNALVRVNKGKSRGKEVGSNWVVQVKDSSGNFINAVQGTDYSITFGSLGSDIMEIKVTQPKIFRIINNVFGYTTANNNFPGTGYGSVNVNEDSTFYILNVQGVVENNQDIITLPKINAEVTIQNQISSTPVQTGYSGANISVKGIIDNSSGNYSIKDLNTGIITNVPMTEAQWIQEFNTRTNITLEIKRKGSNEVIVTKDGLGPHTNINTPVGDFIIQFKTILK